MSIFIINLGLSLHTKSFLDLVKGLRHETLQIEYKINREIGKDKRSHEFWEKDKSFLQDIKNYFKTIILKTQETIQQFFLAKKKSFKATLMKIAKAPFLWTFLLSGIL